MPHTHETDQLGSITETDLEKVEAFSKVKHTSVLVVFLDDMKGSTALKQEMTKHVDEEAFLRLKREHDELLTEIITRDGAGEVIKSTGDGLLAVFIEPSTAVERAIEIQEKLFRHPYISIRIGMDMGQVRVEGSGGIKRDLFGRHVDWAARAESLGEGGHIIVTRSVYIDASGWIPKSQVLWKSHGFYIVKDGEQPLEVFEPYNHNITVHLESLRGRRFFDRHTNRYFDNDLTVNSAEQKSSELHSHIEKHSDGSSIDSTILEEATTTIEITIDRDFDRYTDADQELLLRGIREFLKMQGDFKIRKKRRGSIKLTLELPHEEVKKLFGAIKAGEFGEYGVVDAELPELGEDQVRRMPETFRTEYESLVLMVALAAAGWQVRVCHQTRGIGPLRGVTTREDTRGARGTASIIEFDGFAVEVEPAVDAVKLTVFSGRFETAGIDVQVLGLDGQRIDGGITDVRGSVTLRVPERETYELMLQWPEGEKC